MKNIPSVVTAASVAALMGAKANADPVGNPMLYAQDITITGAATGTGSGTGTGVFDSDGSLDVSSSVFTSVLGGSITGTVVSTTNYQGAIAADTWTFSGTSTGNIVSCTGNPLVCGSVVIGPQPPETGGAIFTLDILTGGTWMTNTPSVGVNLLVDHTLTPVAVPAPGQSAAIPTMPAYGLGITAIALFGAAATRLRGRNKPG